MCVRPNGTTRFLLNGYSWNFVSDFLKKSVVKIQVPFISEKYLQPDTLCEYVCTCMIISIAVLLRMRNISDEICRGKKDTIFVQ